MFLDNWLCFGTNLSTPQAITATANSASVIDVTGAGVGNAPRMIGGYPQLNTAIGADMGLGDGEAVPQVVVQVSTAGTGSGTITVSLQEAVDNGSYSPGTWNTIYQSSAFVGSTLVAGTEIVKVDLPPRLPGTLPPRFYQLVYTVSGTATASVTAFIGLNTKSSLTGGQYPSNYIAV